MKRTAVCLILLLLAFGIAHAQGIEARKDAQKSLRSTLDEAMEYLNYVEQGDRYFEGRPQDFASFLERNPEFKNSTEAVRHAPDPTAVPDQAGSKMPSDVGRLDPVNERRFTGGWPDFGDYHSTSNATPFGPRQELVKLQKEYEQYLADETAYGNSVTDHLNKAIRELASTVLIEYAGAKHGNSGEFHAENINTLTELIDAKGLRDIAEALGERFAAGLASKLKGAAGLTPELFETVMQLLTLHQDQIQREALDRWRESIDQRRAFWEQELQKQPNERGRSVPPVPRARTASPIADALSKGGFRVISAADAVAHRHAQIEGRTLDGYSSSSVTIANLGDQWLAIDFSNSFLQPQGDSGSQRIGLISVMNQTASFYRESSQPVLLASSTISQLPRQIGVQPIHYARQNWVFVGPRARTTATFNSVCLDRSRGVPRNGESFTVSSMPLPERLARLILAAAYGGTVPQSFVWDTISQNKILWFDARTEPEAQRAFKQGNYEQAFALYRGLLDLKPADPDLLRHAGISLYFKGLSEGNSAKARDYLAESTDFFLDALDLGGIVSIPVKHLKGIGPFQQLVPTTLTFVPARIRLETSTSNVEFNAARADVRLELSVSKAYRLSLRIMEPGKKSGGKTFNLHPSSCVTAQESIDVGALGDLSWSSIRCTPSSQGAAEVLARLIRGS